MAKMNSWKLNSTMALVVFACATLTVECSATSQAPSLGSALPAAGNVAKYPGADFGSRLAACIAALPSGGGVCDAREEGADLALSSDVIIEKPYTTIYLPHSSIQMGGHSIVVRAAAHGVSLLAESTQGPFPTKGQTRLRYSGKACAVQIGDPSENTVGFRADNLFVDLTAADSAASGLCITRTQNMEIQQPTIFGASSIGNQQVLIKLDGTGNYTGGLIQQPFLNGGNVHIWFTGPVGTPQGANAVTVLHAHSVGNGGSSIAVKMENGDGNIFLGGDFENLGTAFFMGGRAYGNSLYSVRMEGNTKDLVMNRGAQYNMVQTPETPKYVDHGVRNSILLGRYTSTSELAFRTTEASTCADRTLTLNGANPGDTIALGTPPPPPNGFFSAFVSMQDVVTVRYCSLLEHSAVSGTFRVEVSVH